MNGKIYRGLLLAVVLALAAMAVAQTDTSQPPNSPPATTNDNNGMNGQNNMPASQANSNDTMQNNEPIVLVDPGKIYNQDPTSWVGKRVELQNVMVEDADKAGNFWVGRDNDHRLLVVKDKSNPDLNAKEFHKGDIVTIDGTIHPAGEVEAQEMDTQHGNMKKARHSSGVFLLADDVKIASSTEHK